MHIYMEAPGEGGAQGRRGQGEVPLPEGPAGGSLPLLLLVVSLLLIVSLIIH